MQKLGWPQGGLASALIKRVNFLDESPPRGFDSSRITGRMKRCTYCGKEYPDEATLCALDREPLVAIGAHPPMAKEQMETADQNVPYLAFPDYQWSARDAWKCVGIIVCLEVVLETSFLALDSHFLGFHWWYKSGFGYFFIEALYYAIYLLVAAYFARTETLATFWKGFGLDRKPSKYVWSGIAAALVIRCFGHFMLVHGWGNGVTNHDIIGFRHTIGPERYLFLVPGILLAPLFEESINRGFLYKAFRGSYPVGISMVLLVAWTAGTHGPYYSQSWLAAFDLSLLTLVQCYLREKSDSLWDCILCHFAFNASLFVDATLH